MSVTFGITARVPRQEGKKLTNYKLSIDVKLNTGLVDITAYNIHIVNDTL